MGSGGWGTENGPRQAELGGCLWGLGGLQVSGPEPGDAIQGQSTIRDAAGAMAWPCRSQGTLSRAEAASVTTGLAPPVGQETPLPSVPNTIREHAGLFSLPPDPGNRFSTAASRAQMAVLRLVRLYLGFRGECWADSGPGFRLPEEKAAASVRLRRSGNRGKGQRAGGLDTDQSLQPSKGGAWGACGGQRGGAPQHQRWTSPAGARTGIQASEVQGP